MWLSHSISRYLSKRNKGICPHKDLDMNVYGSVICNSQTENNPNINQQVNWWYIYTMEYYSAMQRNKPLINTKTTESQNDCVE